MVESDSRAAGAMCRITPEMLNEIGDYLADIMDVGREQGRQTAEVVAQIIADGWLTEARASEHTQT